MNNNFDAVHEEFKDFDFAEAKPVSAIPALAKLQAASGGKTRITMRVDSEVVAIYRARAEMSGANYQSLMNEALKQAAQGLTLAEVVRKTIQETLRAA